MTYYMLLDTSKPLNNDSISSRKGFPDIVMITDDQWDIYDFMLGEGADTYEIEEYNYDMVKYINSEYSDFPLLFTSRKSSVLRCNIYEEIY